MSNIRARFLAFAIALIILLGSASISALISVPQAAESGEGEQASASAYTGHAPIFIDGDSAFNNTTGVARGNGTFDDPYIIENLLIDATGHSNAISIRNSSSHFRITGCWIIGAKSSGILLSGVSNGTIENCNVSRHSFYGITLLSSTNITISNNTCSSNLYGINLLRSEGNSILNNSCRYNSFYGIALMTSANNTISNNTCYYSQFGIELQMSDGNNVTRNNCSGGQYGISLFRSMNNSLSGNVWSLDQYGLQMRYSSNNTLSNNTCLSSAVAGILAESSNNNTLTSNVVLGNQYGLEFQRSRLNQTYGPDYYFYKNGSTYFAKNNATNATSNGTDARAVIQSVIDSLGTNPTRFFFDGSEYIINTSGKHEDQYFPDPVWEIGIKVTKQISFNCNGTTFKAAPGLPNPFLVFYIYHADFVEIRGARINCNQGAQAVDRFVMGLMAHWSNYLLVERCEIFNFGGYGIFIDVGSSCPTIRYNYLHDNVNYQYAHGIAMHNNGREGLIIGNRLDKINYGRYAIFVDSIDKVRVIGNKVGEANGWGIMISEKCNDTLVIGNTVVRQGTDWRSIVIADCYYTQVIDNHVFGKSQVNKAYGAIYVNYQCLKSVIRNNHLTNATVLDNANGTTIYGNDGYLIEELPPDFTIYNAGSSYCATNATGALIDTNANFSALMLNVTANATEDARIVLLEGEYLVQKSGTIRVNGTYYGLKLNKSLRIEGRGAVMTMADAIGDNYSMLFIDKATDLRVSGIAFDVNSDGQGGNLSLLSSWGIRVNGTIKPVIQKCEFYDFTAYGIDLNGTPAKPTMMEPKILTDRTFSRNTIYGILLASYSDNNSLSMNNCSGSTSFGVKISSYSTNNTIWNNTFAHNNLTGDSFDPSISQAYDGCIGNWWNTSGTPHGYGNYWGDWRDRDSDNDSIQDAPYNLTGGLSQKDFYPLNRTTVSCSCYVPDFMNPPLNGNLGDNGWYVSSVLISYLPTIYKIDYGFYYIFYELDGGNTADFAGDISVSGSGSHSIDFLVLDIIGNLRTVSSTAFNIDIMAPLIEISINGTIGTNGWYRSNANVTMLVTDDASGVNLTRYRINYGSWHDEIWQNGTVRLNLTDGEYDIQYSSVDNASNEGQPKNIQVNVDTDAPFVKITTESGVFNKNKIGIQWDAYDYGSRIAGFEVVIDNNMAYSYGNETYSATLNLTEGNHSIAVRAIDVAGNSANSSINVDIEIPDEPIEKPLNLTTLIAMFGIISVGVAAVYLWTIMQRKKQEKIDKAKQEKQEKQNKT